MNIQGVLFDKDGTLFDFAATWGGWAEQVIRELAAGDLAIERGISGRIRFDLERGEFLPDSPVIAGTHREVTELVHPFVQGKSFEEVQSFLALRAAKARLVPATDLRPFLSGLASRGVKLGVMTNDTEGTARAHLSQAGVEDCFDFVAGCDSGFGAKPDPAPLLAFADATGIAPENIVMVGDSTHDLIAARAAGMEAVGVLTGMAGAVDLAPYADAVLPDIGHLSAWIDDRRD